MTLADLVALYEAHRNCHKLNPKAHAMRVVVMALREVICDNVYMTQECCGSGVPSRDGRHAECCGDPVHSITRDNLINSFNEILASDGGEAAGGPTSNDGQAATSALPSPAADVCEWHDDAFEGAFLPGCDTPEVWFRVGGDSTPKEEGYNFCPSCGKPISFKEIS
jgi:hypothetical protein